MDTIRFERLPRELILMVLAERDPSEVEWSRFLAFVESHVWTEPRVLVHSAGGAPNAAQRKALERVMTRWPGTPVAVCTDSVTARGTVTAMGWLYGSFRAFRRTETRDALRWLGRDGDALEATAGGRIIELERELVASAARPNTRA